ncbi:MAG: hypothetical protein GC159_11010 [Phycisphaera sp.]|nr:hypothetical protein [Phycisphaera sp.]
MRPNGNRQFGLDPELHVLDAVLSDALKTAAPAHLVQRIYDQTVGHLPYVTPGSELQEIEQVLRRELSADIPADLSAKVYQATVTSLPHYLDEELTALDANLSQSMKAAAPAGLSDRILAATSSKLGDHEREVVGAVDAAMAMGEAMPEVAGRRDPVVLARIGFTTWVRRVSMAAAIVMGVSAGWWLYQYAELPHAEAPDPTFAALEREVDRFADSLNGSPTQLDTQIMNLAADMHHTEAIVQTSPYTDPLLSGNDDITNELSLLEAELGSF